MTTCVRQIDSQDIVLVRSKGSMLSASYDP